MLHSLQGHPESGKIHVDETDQQNLHQGPKFLVNKMPKIFSTKIQFKSEEDKGDLPFEYIGLVNDYNGCNLVQYIRRFLKSHGWDIASNQIDIVPM